MKKIVVVGYNGLLGSWICEELRSSHKVVGVSSSSSAENSVDMSDSCLAEAFLNKIEPDVIINLAAFANVDQCEVEPDKAYRLNALINKNIGAYLSNKQSCYCISISTDHIYDSETPSTEDKFILRNVYAVTKKAGEDVLPQNQSVILRTNFFGKSRVLKKSLSDWLYDSFKSGTRIQLYTDSYFSPLHGSTVASMVSHILKKPSFGVFNLGSREGMSKADFALNLAAALDIKDPLYDLIKYQKQLGRVPRPSHMCMNVGLFERSYDVQLPTLIEEIYKCKKEYCEERI